MIITAVPGNREGSILSVTVDISIPERTRNRYLKNNVSKSITHVMKHADFIGHILQELFGKTDTW